MITEDYVSFEIAKLLKEKKFNVPCHAYWHEDKNEIIVSHSMYPIKNITNPCFFGPAAPTLQMAMKWLREVHNILIVVDRAESHYYWELEDNINGNDIDGCGECQTYEEAVEAAIKYCLTNLI